MINRIFNFQFSIFNLRFSGKEIVKNPLFSGSAIMIVGSNVANFFAYIYHLILGRILGPSSYSELATLISILGLMGVISSSFYLVIVKFVSSAKKNERKAMLSWLSKKGFILGVSVLLVFSALVPFLSSSLQIDSKTLFLVGPIFLVSTLAFINKSFLLGLLKFEKFIGTALSEAFLKLILGLLFVYLGLSVFGATLGMFLAFAAGWVISRFFLKEFLGGKERNFKKSRQLFIYSIPIIFQTIAVTSLYSTDIILVKHFFPPYEAGLYASLSTLGRIIFFGAAPVSTVMFPMISRRYAKGENYRKIFIYSLLLTMLIASGVLLIYSLFPEFSIKILFGTAYLEAAPLLFWFGVFMALFTLSSLFISYFLSIEKTKVVVFPLIAAAAQVVGIWFWHDTILSVIKVSIFSTSFLIASLLLYFGHESRRAKQKA